MGKDNYLAEIIESLLEKTLHSLQLAEIYSSSFHKNKEIDLAKYFWRNTCLYMYWSKINQEVLQEGEGSGSN